MIQVDPKKRIKASKALEHPYIQPQKRQFGTAIPLPPVNKSHNAGEAAVKTLVNNSEGRIKFLVQQ